MRNEDKSAVRHWCVCCVPWFCRSPAV